MQRRFMHRTMNVEIIRSNSYQTLLRMACEAPIPQGTPTNSEHGWMLHGSQKHSEQQRDAELITSATQNRREMSSQKTTPNDRTNNDHHRGKLAQQSPWGRPRKFQKDYAVATRQVTTSRWIMVQHRAQICKTNDGNDLQERQMVTVHSDQQMVITLAFAHAWITNGQTHTRKYTSIIGTGPRIYRRCRFLFHGRINPRNITNRINNDKKEKGAQTNMQKAPQQKSRTENDHKQQKKRPNK